MFVDNIVFDPERDVKSVEQTGYLDLARANAMSSIPSQISNVELSYNEIDDPRSIGGRPSDSFEAASMARTVASYKAPVKDSDGE